MESIHALAQPPVQGSLGGAMRTSANAMERGGNAVAQTANDIANTATGPQAINAGGGHVAGVKGPDLIHSLTHLTALSTSYRLNAKALSTVDDVAKTLMNMGADSAARAS